ncbi:MAG: hypothetical protein KKE73_07530 [Proteobacteria bacterium]|nr:hypothetical protein [Pseudomonadota bacterium]
MYIELNRTFHQISNEKEISEEEIHIRAMLGGKADSWADVLSHSRVVLLAEAGTGKTKELKAKTKELQEKGKNAFYLPIEDLAGDELRYILSSEDLTKFEIWASSEEPAWFFLDSVDEAKLSNPTFFRRALNRLAHHLNGSLSNANVVIASRVSDWQATADLQTVEEILPLSIRPDHPSTSQSKKTEQDSVDEVSIDTAPILYTLDPLSTEMMRIFASGRGINDVSSFMDAIERADAEIFAARPQDLLDLIAYWLEYGKIDSFSVMMEFSIKKKLREVNSERDQRRPLSSELALMGATRLAAALTMCRKSSVIIPDNPIAPDRLSQSIEAAEVLSDWTATQINALLNRAIFDEATYGRVRFHHRSVREYLGAKWFYQLIAQGKNRRAIERLFFADKYGVSVVRPSMEAVAAWLSLWDERFRQRLFVMAPDVLLEYGDPSQLPLEFRSQLVKQFAKCNEDRNNSGCSFDIPGSSSFDVEIMKPPRPESGPQSGRPW